MDVVSLWQHGIDNAVAVLGTAATPHHVRTLVTLTDEILFCFDGDDAGRRAAWRALEQSLEAQLLAEAEAFGDCSATEDFVEGIEAFLAKRKPRFRGR
jgi:DNA primase